MDLIEIGALLREERERKGLSVDAVEEKTKIAPSVIAALEEGNRDRFPHPVYARGFVRSYAMLLGLDAAELCAHFSREYPVPTETDHPEPHAPQITVRMHDSGRVDLIVRIAAIVGILLLGALGWYAFDVYRSRNAEPAPVQEPAAPEAPAPSPAPAQSVAPESLPAPLTQMQEVADGSKAAMSADEATGNASFEDLDASTSAAVPDAAAVPAAAPEAKVEKAAPAAPPKPPTPAVAGAERSLRISAHSASWLQARPDGKVVDYFLRKGESATITFRESLNVKFGNAGGVNLELDGKPYPFEAKIGEVKTLVVE